MPRYVPTDLVPNVLDPRVVQDKPSFDQETDPGVAGPSIKDSIKAGIATGSLTGEVLGKAVPAIEHAVTGEGPDPLAWHPLRAAGLGVDKDFTPPWELLQNTKYAKYASMYTGVNSMDEWNTVSANIDMQEQFMSAMAAHPMVSWPVMIGAAIADPINLVPVFNAATAPSKLRTIANTSMKLAAVNAGFAAYETPENIYMNGYDIAVAAIAGGVLGAGAGALKHTTELNTLRKEIQNRLKLSNDLLDNVTFSKDANGNITWNRSAGAAEVTKAEAARLDEFTAKVLKVGTVTQHLRGATYNSLLSDLPTVRALGQKVFGTSLRMDAPPTDFVSMHSKVEQEKGLLAGLYNSDDEIFAAYSQRAPKAERLARRDFDAEVAMAMDKKDINPNWNHEIPEVNQMAELYAKHTRERWGELVSSKLVDDLQDVSKRFYLSRVWNKDATRALTNDQIQNLIAKQMQRTPDRFIDIDEAAVQFSDLRQKVLYGTGLDELDTLAEKLDTKPDITLGASSYTPDTGKGGKGSFSKARNKQFDSDLLREAGLLENNYRAITNDYMMKTRKMLEARRLLDSENVATITDLQKKMMKEKADFLDQAKEMKGINEKKLQQLSNQMDYEIEQGMALIKEHFGTIRQRTKWSDAVSLLKSYTGSLTLPNVGISQMLEPIQGLLRVGLKGGGLAQLEQLATNPALAKMAKEEAQSIGSMLDLAMNETIRMIVSGEDAAAMLTRNGVTKITDRTNNAVAKLSGIQYLTAMQKLWFHVGIGDGMAREIRNWKAGSISAKAKQRLMDLGINEGNVDDILAQIKKHGAVDGNFTLMNAHKWDKGIAKDKIAQALQREVSNTVITPDMGEVPTIFQTTEWGRMVGQLRSFTASSQVRLLVSRIQDKNASVIVASLLVAIAQGYMQYAIKSTIAGFVPETDPQTIMMEGMTRSGFMPLFWDMSIATFAQGRSSRYHEANIGSLVLGPSYNTVKNVVEFGKSMKDPHDDWYQTAAKGTKLVPLLNFMYLGRHIQEALKEESKSNPRSQARRRRLSAAERKQRRSNKRRNK